MKSPIKNKVKTVFIPVSDIQRAKEWYSNILGIEEGEIVFDHLFIPKKIDGGSGIIFDTMPMWRDEHGEVPTINAPVIQFETDHIHNSYQFMKENGVELVTEIQYDQWFVFRDPDGNMLMVCQSDSD